MRKTKFYLNPENIIDIASPFFLLEYRDWDDFGRKTTFYLTYYDSLRKPHYIDKIKIMNEDNFDTREVLEKTFTELGDNFCSIGQSMDYYSSLYNILGKSDFDTYLEKVNDVAFLNPVRDRFEFNPTFQNSLIRTSEAEKAFKEARNKIYNIRFERDFNFDYRCKLDNAEDFHKVSFNFSENVGLPNRVIALIGKNGTGKTQFMAKFALDLSGQSREIVSEDTFQPHRPLFSKVIAISYSAFDKFSRPEKSKSFSYKYCGLKDEDGRLLSAPKMIANYKNSVSLILNQRRQSMWSKVMKSIVGEYLESLFYEKIFVEEDFEILNNRASKLLSSGQSFLMYVITELLAHIRENSILLFDEPEMHLHPNAIANFVRMLDLILEKYDSYSILATHSPIILQEIPSRYVNVFDRQANIPMIYKLGTESFGENLDVLTETIFKTIEVDDNYKSVLRKLSQNNSYKEVLELFDDKLSLSAKTFLLNQYKNPLKELDA